MAWSLNTDSLQLAWSRAPWDEVVCGFPVLQIDSIRVLGAGAEAAFAEFERQREQLAAGLVSCRLPHDCLIESMLLETRGFRFIEMVHAPELIFGASDPAPAVPLLDVSPARTEDMPALLDIAGQVFSHERFRMDHRLDPDISDQRYRNWVANTPAHPRQHLHVIRDGQQLIGFFITEDLADGCCYWHLTAIAAAAQGRGYGRRAWSTMLQLARQQGARRVRTSVVARNYRVLNLYARLGFSLSPPTMTFHWLRA
jgi:ribosomal protein S18 acetylase RimI-like enzyme